MKKLKVLIYVFLILAAILIGQTISTRVFTGSTNEPPQVVAGILDLRGVDLNVTGPIRLDGIWHYQTDSSQIEVRVPSVLLSEDYGIYVLKILLPSTLVSEQLGIKTTSIRMAHRLAVDELILGASGEPSPDIAKVVRENIPYAAYFFDLDADHILNVSIEVSLTGYQYSGIVQPIYFGLARDISKLQYRSTVFETISIFALLMTAIYFFMIYVFLRVLQQNEKSLLYFSGYCFFFALFLGFYNEKVFFNIFPTIGFSLGERILNISLTMTFSTVILYINSIDSRLFPNPLKKAILGLFFIYGFCVVFMPNRLFTSLQSALLLVAFMNNILLILFLSKALRNKYYGNLDRQGIYLLFSGALLILVNLICSNLYNLGKLTSYAIPLLTIYIFVIIMALFLARRYAIMHQTSENLKKSLILADQYKDEFLIQTSHELKTPLHGIINITDDIIAKNKVLSGHQIEDLQYVKSIALRLSSLINDIIDFQNIKVNNFATDISVFDVHAVIKPVVEVLERIFSSKKVQVFIDFHEGQFIVRTDEQRLRQIVYNLVGNSFKFTNHGQIRISSHLEGTNLVLLIKDTGIGITADQIPDLFNGLNYSSQQGLPKRASKGIGLTVARRLARFLGGDVWLNSTTVGEGSEFALSIPLAFEPTENETKKFTETMLPQEKIEPSANPAHIILLIDDEVSNHKVIQRLFALTEYELLFAYNAEQAQSILIRKKNIDVVLLDVMLPGISGFKMCQWIRERYTAIELPVILLTVKGATEDIALGFEVGADDYLIKPFSGRELEARVKTQLQRKASFNKAVAAELAFLQAQIKPHFIFNALSTISSLSTRDPQKTEAMILDLADFLRSTFDIDSTTALTQLNREVAMVKSYLAVEQARFPKRLDVEYEVDDNIECSMPVLCIQPLVENALKHGVLRRLEGGKVKIVIRDGSMYISICIEDNGVGMTEEAIVRVLSDEPHRGHIGISNIHNRLLKLYGNGLRIHSEPNIGTKVSFEIPKILHD